LAASSDFSAFVENHLVKKFAPVKIERILTDGGAEYTIWHQEAISNHKFEKVCKHLGIKHTTKVVKTSESIRGEKEAIEKRLIFA